MSDLQINLPELGNKMTDAIKHLVANLEGIRTARVSPGLLDPILVLQYGALVPLKQVALVGLLDSTALKVSVFDHSMIEEVKKAIRDKMQLNAVDMDGGLKVVVPPLTEERKKQLIKHAQEYGENEKIVIRNLRKGAFDLIKTFKGKISEDDMKRQQKEVDKLHDKAMAEIDALINNKIAALN